MAKRILISDFAAARKKSSAQPKALRFIFAKGRQLRAAGTLAENPVHWNASGGTQHILGINSAGSGSLFARKRIPAGKHDYI
jgi:hypothetical protein